MRSMMAAAAAVLLVHTASALGPPNGTVGTLDFRYPDRIVEPLVPCEREGVFPHPRDCSWYYRCYDRYGYNFFWRAYFQCEPGTQFSDELDQCIFHSDNTGCASYPPDPQCQDSFEKCSLTNICPVTDQGTGFVYSTEVCLSAVRVCHGHANQLICAEGQVYDAGSKKCISASDICGPPVRPPGDPPIVCEDQLQECTDYKVCRAGENPQLLRLCNINKNCYNKHGSASSYNICNEGSLFNAVTNQCTLVPTVSETCPDNTLIVNMDVPCVQETETCQVYTDCDSRQSVLACNSFFMCGDLRPRSSVCSVRDYQVFAPQINRCITVRDLIGVSNHRLSIENPPCVKTGLLPTSTISLITTAETTTASTTTPTTTLSTTTTVETTTPIDFHNYFDGQACSTPGTKPFAEGHTSLGCNIHKFCQKKGDKPEVSVTGCDRYFECSATHKLRIKSCNQKYFYNYKTENCANGQKLYGDDYDYCSISTTDVTFEIKVKCERQGQIPDMTEEVKQLYCEELYLCNNGDFMHSHVVCDSYYYCDVQPLSTVVSPVLMTCDGDLKFDLVLKKCSTLPSNICVRRRYTNEYDYNRQLNIYMRDGTVSYLPTTEELNAQRGFKLQQENQIKPQTTDEFIYHQQHQHRQLFQGPPNQIVVPQVIPSNQFGGQPVNTFFHGQTNNLASPHYTTPGVVHPKYYHPQKQFHNQIQRQRLQSNTNGQNFIGGGNPNIFGYHAHNMVPQ